MLNYFIAVLFRKLRSRIALEALEKVDDEGDRIGVTFIKVKFLILILGK